MKNTQPIPLRYCLYARKSSESDERQTASLGAQMAEMTKLAMKHNLEVVHVIEESKSAKQAENREGFTELLTGLMNDEWNAVLAWAPDRLSRNAGDLGRLVDLMDRGHLHEVRTFDQTFTNTPDEKFLLMLLGSQAKLENDYRGKNIMRGLVASCERGKRPGRQPLGFKMWRDPFNWKAPSKVQIDEERSSHIKKLFELVADEGHSGRDAAEVVYEMGLRSRTGKKVSLGSIYNILKDSFYYGEFEYPKGSGNWYKGENEPIITKKLYEKTQVALGLNKSREKCHSVSYILKRVKCGKCGSKITRTTTQKPNGKQHTYFVCQQSRAGNCKEKYVNEETFWSQIARLIEASEKPKILQKRIKREVEKIQHFTTINEEQYIAYLLKNGNRFDRYQLMQVLPETLKIIARQLRF